MGTFGPRLAGLVEWSLTPDNELKHTSILDQQRRKPELFRFRLKTHVIVRNWIYMNVWICRIAVGMLLSVAFSLIYNQQWSRIILFVSLWLAHWCAGIYMDAGGC